MLGQTPRAETEQNRAGRFKREEEQQSAFFAKKVQVLRRLLADDV